MEPTDKQPPAHHFDPDMSDAVLLAMLDNPHHADAIANLSDEELNQVAADTPLDDADGGDNEMGEPVG